MATTMLSNLFDPQVVGDLVEKKFVDNMVFAPLATIDMTLSGRPGSVLTLPAFSWIGDAEGLAENSSLTPVALNESTVSVSVTKIAKGVEITDEAALSGYGDPLGEAADQIVLSLASKTDNDMLSVLSAITGTMLYQTSTTSTEVAVGDINLALEKFGEDIDIATKVVLVSPALYTKIRATGDWLPASEISADKLIKGAVGEIYGCQIIVSNKLKANSGTGNAFIVMPGALRLIMKRDVLVESERDIKAFKTLITASKHYACYLYDSSKAIKIAKKSA